MTALGKLLRTTAFKLTLVYLTVFALFAAFLLGYFAWNTRRLITEQITQTVDAEISGLSEQYNLGGIRRLVHDRGSALAPPGIEPLSGDHPDRRRACRQCRLAADRAPRQTTGWTETIYRRIEEGETRRAHRALVRVAQLPGGFRLLVGRDLEERERLYDVVLDAGKWSAAVVVVLGLAGGFFVARRVLRRVDAMTETTRSHHGGRSVGPLAGRRHRRRARPAGAQPQRHAGAHRGADARPEGSLRQHRA